jgi:sterol desaturase/sphingolipid hydroxylase (fatty acid hydroxylase superfamily)
MNQAQSVLKPKNNGTKKIFDNPLLEKLSRTHIAIPIAIFLVLSSALLYYAFLYTALNSWLIPLLFFAGFLFFTLLEYVTHRFLFHMHADTSLKKSIQYNLHGIHHEYPKDKDRLAMPPPVSILLATMFFAIFYLLLNTNVFGFLPGMLTGYASYLFVHYIVHAYPPPKNLFKQLWINHSIHHYKDNTVVFGVSSPLWDYIFGTMPSK